MVFAPSTGTMEQAFQDFADAGVQAVFGPLYSREAIQAADLAEGRGMVMLTPLATDEEVSEGRRFVFQGNPTLTMRGRLMARFAVESLSMTDFGILAEYNNSLSERMAEGFQDEIERMGAQLRFVKMVDGKNGWFRLADQMQDDSLAGLDAIYLPITGGQAPSLIKAALDNLDRLELPIKLLGNKEWDDLPSRTQPSKYSATYTNDYYVSDANPLVEVFRSKYAELAEEEPGPLAFIGYDIGQYLANLISRDDSPLEEKLLVAPPYQGLAIKLHFAGGNVNQAMFYERYRNGQIELLR
jgi:ABC-type branched-subunit amino acid transport system substrate-binding protein